MIRKARRNRKKMGGEEGRAEREREKNHRIMLPPYQPSN